MQRSILFDVWDFIRRPSLSQEVSPLNFKNGAILLGSALLLVIPYALILETLDLSQFDHKMEAMWEDYKWMLVLFAVLLAPIIEEMIFRYHLRMSQQTIFISLLLALLLVADMRALIIVFIGYLLFLMYRLRIEKPLPLPFVVYISNSFFALVHLSNFENFDLFTQFYWIPLLIGVQFIIGLLFCFIRVHYGIKFAIIFHALYNGIVAAPIFLFEDYFMSNSFIIAF